MKAERKPLSKKTRFDVFKRDLFTCQYCGTTPPAVVLEVDHIQAVANGGENTIDNLITSCFDCNRGKGARSLSSIPNTVQEKLEAIKEREEQIKAFNRQIKAKRKRQDVQIDSLSEILYQHKNNVFSDTFRESVRTHFLEAIPQDQLENAMHRACLKCPAARDAVKYFCGTCWGIIKGRGRY